ncbi:hypothetical protein MTBBW1_1040051 [Desulfamplus magnetovallimortis]|uniref:Uncharacterized protein n=1 Tax=Desulfamplus magnetovallimortis TaxID=1246637 RepID=A0A1W1H569_9BACT|nr:hypothetical protein MTBBW1_1040051 [Desulfamplus magnetovallimortis]
MLKVFIKTDICGDFYITYLADDSHNRKDESRFKNSQLLRLSYKLAHSPHPPNPSHRLESGSLGKLIKPHY